MLRVLIISILAITTLVMGVEKYDLPISDISMSAQHSDCDENPDSEEAPVDMANAYLDVFSPVSIFAKVQFHVYLIFEIVQQPTVVTYPKLFSSSPIIDTDFIKTLFRQYISTKAP